MSLCHYVTLGNEIESERVVPQVHGATTTRKMAALQYGALADHSKSGAVPATVRLAARMGSLSWQATFQWTSGH